MPGFGTERIRYNVFGVPSKRFVSRKQVFARLAAALNEPTSNIWCRRTGVS
jgi:hypothetical protein